MTWGVVCLIAMMLIEVRSLGGCSFGGRKYTRGVSYDMYGPLPSSL